MSTMTLTHISELSPGAQGRAHAGRTGGSVRLTRRGRLVVLLGALLLVLLAGVFLGAGSVASEEAGTPAPTEIVMVGEGDTLWGIASDIAEDGGDVRSVIVEIERLNALDSEVLTLGQRLRVPASD